MYNSQYDILEDNKLSRKKNPADWFRTTLIAVAIYFILEQNLYGLKSHIRSLVPKLTKCYTRAWLFSCSPSFTYKCPLCKERSVVACKGKNDVRTSLGQLHDLGATDFFFFFVYLTFIDYPYDYHHFLLLLASLIPEVQVLFSSSVSRKARGV